MWVIYKVGAGKKGRDKWIGESCKSSSRAWESAGVSEDSEGYICVKEGEEEDYD